MPLLFGDDVIIDGDEGQSHDEKQQSNPSVKGKEALDRYLAESIDSLSMEDRRKALEDVHGIAATSNNSASTEEIIPDLNKCLDSLENHLFLIKHGTAYERAESQNKAFVLNRSLRLLFLRQNEYIPKAAAEQMIRFFDTKEELFGTEKLAQEILLEDLDPLSQECVASGCFQFLKKPDRANRPIFLSAPGLRKPCPYIHEMRSQFYMIMTFLRELEDARKYGVVGILYTVGKFRDPDMGQGARRLAKVGSSLPIPFSGMHFCYDDVAQHILVSALVPLLPLIMAPKFQTHFGTDMEVLYALRRYGISEDSIPIINCEEERILDDHKQWYQDRKEKDRTIAIEKEALSVFGMPDTTHAIRYKHFRGD